MFSLAHHRKAHCGKIFKGINTAQLSSSLPSMQKCNEPGWYRRWKASELPRETPHPGKESQGPISDSSTEGSTALSLPVNGLVCGRERQHCFPEESPPAESPMVDWTELLVYLTSKWLCNDEANLNIPSCLNCLAYSKDVIHPPLKSIANSHWFTSTRLCPII